MNVGPLALGGLLLIDCSNGKSMFAFEIAFRDGVSQPETIFVRRPQVVVGASDYAHVVVDDMASLGFQLRIVRDLGRRFRIKPVGVDAETSVARYLEGVHVGEAAIDLGPVALHITALDTDLLVREVEPLDRAGIRVLRLASSTRSPLFPALVVLGANPLTLSFVPEQAVYVGRSKRCALRLDSADISGEHARIGYESGQFWVEDLGSTNGTYVRGQQVSGRIAVPPGEAIVLGREVSIIGVTAEDQILSLAAAATTPVVRPAAQVARYPCLVAVSELVRPARIVLNPGASLLVGRDPSSDVWLGAPHVSRKHCTVQVLKSGEIRLRDHSTNGTATDRGILHSGEETDIPGIPCIMDFGGGVTLAVCFSEEEEERFVASGGSSSVFRPVAEEPEVSTSMVRERDSEEGRPPPMSLNIARNRGGPFADFVELYVNSSRLARATFIVGFVGIVIVVVLVTHLFLGL